MRKCDKCEQTKPLDAFYKNATYSDGLERTCKLCRNAANRAKYRENIDQRKAHERIREPLRKEWRKEQIKKHRANNPEKAKARYRLNNKVLWGTIKRLPCEICGDPKSQAHHEDYSKPFDVRWLCLFHHRAVEGRNIHTEVR